MLVAPPLFKDPEEFAKHMRRKLRVVWICFLTPPLIAVVLFLTVLSN